MAEKPRKPRSDLRMYQLPKEVLDQVNEMLTKDNMSYRDIQHWLEAKHSTKVSLSSISRYAFRIYETADRVAKDLEKTKFIVDFIGENPDIDTVKVTTEILKSGLLQRLSSAEDEFNKLPIEQASRLFLQIAKTESSVKRADFEMRRKIDIAFEEMERQLLDAIKHDPVLSRQLHQVLSEAKEKIDVDSGVISK